MANTNKKLYEVSLRVEGMSCTNCSLGIKKALEKQGFVDVDADFATDEVSFKAADRKNTPLAKNTIEKLGYRVVDQNDNTENKWWNQFTIEKKFWISAIFTLPLVLAMFIPVAFLHSDYLHLILASPVFVVGFLHFGKRAYNSLKSGVANMDVLIFLGSTTAFGYSLVGTIYRLGHDYMFYETAASIITIVLLGNLLEHRAVKKTTSAIDELTKIQQVKAKRIISLTNKEGEEIEEVKSSMLQKGDNLLVNTGDRIPVDGKIFWGTASINESMVTGESVPVERGLGDTVIGGTILEHGNIKIKTTAIGRETVLSQIIDMVRKAQRDKPQLQNLADRISMIFVPIVVIIALSTWLIGYFAVGLDFKDALMRGIAVLVIACPCALGLAIPTAVVVGLGRTAKNGILLKGGSVFDKLAKFDKIIFDKTGTLTTGIFKVKNLEITDDTSHERFISLLCSLENHSSHPIAKSIVKEYAGFDLLTFEKVIEEKGLGISAWDKEGNLFKAGSYEIASHLTSDDAHNVYLTVNGKLLGWVDIEDQIKPEAFAAIDYIKKRGISTVLLSGDREQKCAELAKTLSIDEVYFEKRPSEKLEILNRLSTLSNVAMVGDGINDAPALARAFVGISMSNATQVAVNSSDVVLLKGDLSLLPKSMAYAAITRRTIKENLFMAFFYNVMAIPLAVLGMLNPMIAAVAMALSSIIVVLNSLRLKTRRVS